MVVQEISRHFELSDLSAVIDIYHTIDDVLGVDRWITAEMLANFLELPTINPEVDTCIVQRGDRVVAYADFEFSAVTGRAWMEGVVHPDHWGEGIGSQLLAWGEARAWARAEAELAADKSLSLRVNASSRNADAIHLFEQRGFEQIRTFYRMRIDFTQLIEPAPLPDGIELRPFDRDQHAHAVYEAHEESFSDHWGFERDSFEEWSNYALNYAGQDLSMWLVAWEGDEIAGICINRPNEQDPAMGWVGSLGVRRPWRKRGLGLSLLQHSFRLFQDHGYLRAGLGVDASSLTNAVALYQRAGMHVHTRSLVYRKMLRGTAPTE